MWNFWLNGLGTAFYADDSISFLNLRFENDVKMYGTQTIVDSLCTNNKFENDVKMYGTQTAVWWESKKQPFENDVKMYGTQTYCTSYLLYFLVWEWCKNVWYSNISMVTKLEKAFENDVKMYGTQTDIEWI